MHMTIRAILGILLALGITHFSVAQSRPPVPFVEPSCPYEFGCDFLSCVALAQRPLFINDGDSTSVAYWMSLGDSLSFDDGKMYVDQPGVVVLMRPREGFTVGDTIYVLSYTGEGTYDLWYNGKTLNEEIFWQVNPLLEDSAIARLVSGIRMTWWVLLTNTKGEKGWLPLVNSCPGGGACFGEDVINMIPKDSHGF